MLCNAWNLEYIINSFLFSGGVRGPLHVDQTVKFATYLQDFPILRQAPRTTRCYAAHGICNILSTFSYPWKRSEDHLMLIQPGNLQQLIDISCSSASSDDHSTSCNAWNLQYIINISLFSGEIRAPLDLDQTIDFTIDYQHFRVLGGGSEDHTMSCNAWNLQYIENMFPDICNIGNIINY